MSVTLERVREVLDYNPRTGVFTWRKRSGRGQRNDLAGTVAGTLRKGYRRIWIDGRNYQSGRLAWFYTHGVWPEPEIDHIDRDRLNDRLTNLRQATRAQNNANRTGWACQ